MPFLGDQLQVLFEAISLLHTNKVLQHWVLSFCIHKLRDRSIPRIPDDRELEVTRENRFANLGPNVCREEVLKTSGLILVVILVHNTHPQVAFAAVSGGT